MERSRFHPVVGRTRAQIPGMRTHARLSDEGIYKAQTRGVPKWRLQVRLNKLGAEASGFKCRDDLVFVVGAVGLDGHAQLDALIAVRIHELVVVEANDVAVHAGDGLRNANELAGAIGQKIGKCFYIYDSNYDVAPQYYDNMMMVRSKAMMADSAEAGAPEEPSLDFKTIKLEYNVQTKFVLE